MANLVDFVAALRAHVLGDNAITTLIGERFVPLPIDESVSAKPSATYSIIETRPSTTLDGDDDGLLEVRVQIDAWSRDFDPALAVAELIRARMVSASFRATPEQSEGNGVHLYEDQPRLHRFHWRYTCFFPTT